MEIEYIQLMIVTTTINMFAWIAMAILVMIVHRGILIQSMTAVIRDILSASVLVKPLQLLGGVVSVD